MNLSSNNDDEIIYLVNKINLLDEKIKKAKKYKANREAMKKIIPFLYCSFICLVCGKLLINLLIFGEIISLRYLLIPGYATALGVLLFKIQHSYNEVINITNKLLIKLENGKRLEEKKLKKLTNKDNDRILQKIEEIKLKKEDLIRVREEIRYFIALYYYSEYKDKLQKEYNSGSLNKERKVTRFIINEVLTDKYIAEFVLRMVIEDSESEKVKKLTK